MKPERKRPARAAKQTRDWRDREAAEIERLRQENGQLREQLAEHAKRIADLERQLALRQQNSTTTSKPPSSDGLAGQQRERGRRVKSGRPPGGQPGHPGRSPGDTPVVSQALYGVPQVADSVITLGPGEYAWVRVPGDWILQSQIRERVAQDSTPRLVGTLRLYLPTGTLQVRSAEEISVLMRN